MIWPMMMRGGGWLSNVLMYPTLLILGGVATGGGLGGGKIGLL